LGGILQLLARSHLKIFLIPVFVFLVCRIVYVIVFRRSLDVQQRFNSIAVVATTGFAGMALEIILIYTFQNIYGYVYEKIGLIIAVFMFGLAMGGGLSNRMILQRTTAGGEGLSGKVSERKEKDWIKILMVLEAFVVVYAFIMPLVLNRLSFLFFDSEYLFMILVVITGVLTGIEFPIASKLYFLRKGELGATAGTIDSADHTGAFIGAILTGVLFVPIFGITGSCVIIAGLNLMSLLFLVYHFSQKRRAGD
jgi:spermidine synthase